MNNSNEKPTFWQSYKFEIGVITGAVVMAIAVAV